MMPKKLKIFVPKFIAKITIAHVSLGNQQSTMNEITKELKLPEQSPRSKHFGDYVYFISLSQTQYDIMWNKLKEAYYQGYVSGVARDKIQELSN